MRQPVGVLGDVGAEAAELGGQGGEPVGLVAADVRDAAQHAGRRRQRAQRRDRRAPARRPRAGRGRCRAGRRRDRSRSAPRRTARTPGSPSCDRMSGSRLPGCVVDSGQSRTVTVPPETAASARNGAALERSGSMTWSTGLIGPGATAHRLASESSTSTPCSRSIAIGHLDVRQGRAPACRRGVRRRRRRTALRRAAAPRRTARRPTRRSRPCRPAPTRCRAP